MKRFFFVVFCFFIFTSKVFANQPDQVAVSQALASLYSSEGKVTKEQYNEFWQKVGVKNRQEKEKVVSFMKDNFLSVQDYQRETWKCAEESWKAKKILQCVNMKNKLDIVQNSFKKLGQESSLDQIKEASNSVLKAAASHGEIEFPNSQKVQISLELIQKTRANLDKIFEKFNVILRVEY